MLSEVNTRVRFGLQEEAEPGLWRVWEASKRGNRKQGCSLASYRSCVSFSRGRLGFPVTVSTPWEVKLQRGDFHPLRLSPTCEDSLSPLQISFHRPTLDGERKQESRWRREAGPGDREMIAL